jgi:membrane associated rhomboid family serine protease
MIPLRDIIPSRTFPGVTIALIALNTAAFLYEQSMSRPELLALVNTYGLVPARVEWPHVFTAMFLHADWLHFISNMLFLWIFGDNVEDRTGHGRYVVFYFLCGGLATAMHVWSNPGSSIPTIGASGAVAGVMGAYFVLYPRSRILTLVPIVVIVRLVEVPAIVFLGVWFALQLFSGMGSLLAVARGEAVAGVAFWAHIAGFAAGAVLIPVFRRRERLRVEWWHQ